MPECTYLVDFGHKCARPVNTPFDDELCLFHAPKAKKGISGEEFNNRIKTEFIDRKDYIFRGFVFPTGIDFSAMTKEFQGLANFLDAKFEGNIEESVYSGSCVVFRGVNFRKNVIFEGAKFSGGDTDFRETQFTGGDADFGRAQFSGGCVYFRGVWFRGGDANFAAALFSGGLADFEGGQFSGGNTSFVGAQFSGGNVQFGWTKFNGGYADFRMGIFSGGDIDFREAQFNGGDASFVGAQFSGNASFVGAKFGGGNADFSTARFDKDAYFINNTFRGNVDFGSMKFANTSKFYFASPRFLLKKDDDRSLIPHRVIFEHMKFIPNMTYFEDIKNVSHNIISHLANTILIFRYCDLMDVYFSNNNMSLFSFYKCPYEKAFFYSNEWDERREHLGFRRLGLPYRRKNIICDEKLFERSKILTGEERKKFKDACKIEDLKNYREVASLYRRFKVALDATKDYTESGWLYFNEFEMKRRALKEEFEGKNWFASMRERGYYILYSLYKLFMGYGEKPSWSFVWLILFIGIFSIGNLFNGIKNDDGLNVDYDVAWNLPDAGMVFQDWLFSLQYTVSRLLPKTYLPEQWESLSSAGYGIIPFANSLVLILFAVFIGIGLKRHFRRF